jgi:hypothetical protein
MPQMTSWQDLMKHRHIRNAMVALGNLGPVTDPFKDEVKGYCYDDDGGSFKVYYSADDLISMSRAIDSVASWLAVRKACAETEQQSVPAPTAGQE